MNPFYKYYIGIRQPFEISTNDNKISLDEKKGYQTQKHSQRKLMKYSKMNYKT